MYLRETILFQIMFRVDPAVVLQQANKGLISLRHYVESHNGRISDEVNYLARCSSLYY